MTRADDFEAIRALIARYSTLVDSGDIAGLGELFAHGAFVVPGTDTHAAGREAAEKVFARSLRYYDGIPNTMHLVGNIAVDLDASGERATATSSTAVFQSTDTLPLQVILTASYDDTFEKVDGAWVYRERVVTFIHQGETEHHFVYRLGGYRIPRPPRD